MRLRLYVCEPNGNRTRTTAKAAPTAIAKLRLIFWVPVDGRRSGRVMLADGVWGADALSTSIKDQWSWMMAVHQNCWFSQAKSRKNRCEWTGIITAAET